MAKLTLEKITPSAYQAKVEAGTLDAKTIYWLDDGTIYTGGSLYGGKIVIVEEDPAFPELNTIYVDKTTLTLKIWNGVSFNIVSKGYTVNIADDSDDTLLPTAKAVATYVLDKIGELPKAVGVTEITPKDKGIITVTTDGVTEDKTLTSVVHNPVFDKSTNTLTLPIGGSEDLVIKLEKDTAVKAGKYVTDTKEIWLTLAEDGSYDDDSKVIKVPAGDLVDIYTGTATSSTSVSVSDDNVISVNVKISAEEGNPLSIKEDGLYVTLPSDENKLDKVATAHPDEVIVANTDGTIKVSGKKVGGEAIATDPTVDTLATELGVKAYADGVAATVTSNLTTKIETTASTTLDSAKEYADGIVTWKNW